MFYGRVDVYWPEGPIESYRLNKPTVAIGRSTGNDIVLDTTAISRYHVTLTFNNQQVLLEDLESVNGTYVDGVRLAPHDPFVLRGGEEIQIGDILLIFHPPAGISPDTSTEAEVTQRIVRSQPTYKVELEGPDMSVAPGAHGQATLKIENLGDATDRYAVEVEGLPKGWARVDRVEMEIEQGEQGQAVISFKPLRRSETRPGDYPLVVRVRSKSNPSQIVELPTTLQVLPYSGFGMALGNLRTGEKGEFTLYIHNQGNAPLSISLQGVDQAQTLTFQLPKGALQLGPGERRTLTGIVRSRRPRLFGPEREREFAFQAQAHDASNFLVSVPGFYVEKGLLPGWAPAFIIPLVALFALFLAGMILLLFRAANDEPEATPQPPIITSFTASNPVLTLGDTVTFAWNVTNTEALELIVEHGGIQQRHPIQSGATSYTLPFEQTGHYTVILEARSEESSNTATVLIDVQPRAVLELQVLNGTELVRNVQGDVRVTWKVEGAQTLDSTYNLWLESSERSEKLLAAPLPLSGQQDFQIAPQNDQAEWLVTLYAVGQDNVIASTTQKLTIVYPVCELRTTQTIVRSGPGERYPAILPPQPPSGSPEGTLSYSPVARDPSGQWLKVTVGVEGRPGWVPLADFQCTNFDPDRLVSTTDFPSPPTNSTGDSATSTPGTPTVTPRSSLPRLPVTAPTMLLVQTRQSQS